MLLKQGRTKALPGHTISMLQQPECVGSRIARVGAHFKGGEFHTSVIFTLFKNSSPVTKAAFPGTSPDLHLTYLRNLLRYCLLHTDQENTPLFPVSVGDIIFPSAFLQAFPSPSWIIPKLKREPGGRVEVQIKQKQDKVLGEKKHFLGNSSMLELHKEGGIHPFHSKGMKSYAP